MSLKFSLRDLLVLIALISVACAALANAGIWWHSIVVTATLAGMTGIVIWGTLHSGRRRAFACGWLIFSVGYLMLVFGPWTAGNLGSNLITTKGLALLEAKTLGNTPSPPVFQTYQSMDFSSDLSVIYSGQVITNLNTSPQYSPWGSTAWNSISTAPTTTFHATGQWLLASVFGYCGAILAAFLWLRRSDSA